MLEVSNNSGHVIVDWYAFYNTLGFHNGRIVKPSSHFLGMAN